MGQYFVFNAAGEVADTSQARRLVRKTAMKSFRRKERMERVAEYAKSRVTSDSTEDEDVEILGYDLGQDGTIVKPCPSPSSSMVVPVDENVRKLLHHFVNQIAPQLQALGVTPVRNPIVTSFFPYTMQDPGTAAAVLFHSSIHLDRLQRRSWSPTTLHYQGETIRALQEELTYQDTERRIRCLTMVAFLAAAGNITGDVGADRVHKDALKTMAQMCGGLRTVSRMQESLALLLATSVICPNFAPSS